MISVHQLLIVLFRVFLTKAVMQKSAQSYLGERELSQYTINVLNRLKIALLFK